MTGYRVFIVEDEAIVANDIADTLQGLGYTIAGIAKSGEDALRVIPGTSPDLVLMDVNLAGEMDGVETAVELHKVTDTPVIYLTAYADPVLHERAKRTGPYGYMLKPYDERELKSVIEMARYKYEMDRILYESRETYRALTESMPDILYTADMGGNIMYISPQVRKYGFVEKDLVGRSLSSLVHPEDRDRFGETLLRDRWGDEPSAVLFRIPDKADLTRWFENNNFIRHDGRGKAVGMYGILRDVTDRKRAEDAIDLANRKLNLMNNVTRHDILNTIAGLLGCVDMAEAATSQDERVGLFADIRNLTRSMQRQIFFTREYQEVGIHLPAWQDVNAVVARAREKYDTPSDLRIVTELDGVEIYADPMLEKVFFSLIDNAARHGKAVTTIRLSSCISETGLTIACEDDGEGIPPGEKSRIFERGIGKSAGPGLFLIREILGITGITITETGEYGKGARFGIHVPRGTFRPALPADRRG